MRTLKYNIGILLLTGALFSVQGAQEPKAPKNVVVIFADDMGYGDLGCYRELFQGGDDRTLAHQFTPALDTL